MSAQTTYTQAIRNALAGMVHHDFGTVDSVTGVAAGSVPFGVALNRSAAGVVAPANANVFGWSIRSLIGDNAVNNAVEAYGDEEAVGVLRKGYIYVKNVGAAVAKNDPVAVNANGELDAAGAAVSGAIIETAGGTDDIVLIRVDL